MSDSERLTELEIRIAYLEDSLNTLDSVLSDCANRLVAAEKSRAEMLRKLNELEERLAGLDGPVDDDTPPPHY